VSSEERGLFDLDKCGESMSARALRERGSIEKAQEWRARKIAHLSCASTNIPIWGSNAVRIDLGGIDGDEA